MHKTYPRNSKERENSSGLTENYNRRIKIYKSSLGSNNTGIKMAGYNIQQPAGGSFYRDVWRIYTRGISTS